MRVAPFLQVFRDFDLFCQRAQEEPILIPVKENETVVLISLEEYNALKKAAFENKASE